MKGIIMQLYNHFENKVQLNVILFLSNEMNSF